MGSKADRPEMNHRGPAALFRRVLRLEYQFLEEHCLAGRRCDVACCEAVLAWNGSRDLGEDGRCGR